MTFADVTIYGSQSTSVNIDLTNYSILLKYPCISNSSCYPYKVSLSPGKYRFELWGAQGGDGREHEGEIVAGTGGHGAYTSGYLVLSNIKTFYFYLGGKGEDQWNKTKGAVSLGGYNGGGKGGIEPLDSYSPESSAGGGGATDIRFEANSLFSRIMVAAGGGGAQSYIDKTKIIPYWGGAGGDLTGITHNNYHSPGTQTSGNELGIGSDGLSYYTSSGDSTGGCGGGYYGGTITEEARNADKACGGGAGGSSFISGYYRCNAIVPISDTEYKHSNSPNHYSKITFRNPIMYNGEEDITSPNGGIETGHLGHGYPRITAVYIGITKKCTHQSIININFIIVSIIQCSTK